MSSYHALLAQQPGLASIFDAVMRGRERREQRDRLARLDQLAFERDTFERDRLVRADMAEQAQARDATRAKQEQQAAASQAEKAKRTSNALRFVAQGIRENPENRLRYQGMLQDLAKRGDIDPVEMPGLQASDDEVGAWVTSIEGQAAAALGPQQPQKQQRDPRSAFAQQLIDEGLAYGSDPFNRRMAEYNTAELAKQKRQPGPGVVVNTGAPQQGKAIGLTQSQQSAVQGEIMSAEKTLAQMDRIDEAVKAAGGAGELASIWRRGGAALQGVAEKTVGLSAEGKEQLQKRRAAEASIATLRNHILNKLAGSAVSDSEQKRIMESVMDIGDSETDFNAKRAAWRENLEFELQYGTDALVEGLRTGKLGSAKPPPDYDAELDAAYQEGVP